MADNGKYKEYCRQISAVTGIYKNEIPASIEGGSTVIFKYVK